MTEGFGESVAEKTDCAIDVRQYGGLYAEGVGFIEAHG